MRCPVPVRGRGEDAGHRPGSVQINDDCCFFDFDYMRAENREPDPGHERKTRNAAIAACNDIFRNAADAIFRDMHCADLAGCMGPQTRTLFWGSTRWHGGQRRYHNPEDHSSRLGRPRRCVRPKVAQQERAPRLCTDDSMGLTENTQT